MNNSAPISNFSNDDSIDIKRYLSLFICNWYWFAIALFIALTLAYGINRYSQRVFSVSSTILIKDDVNGGMGAIATSVVPGGDIFRSQQNVKNEIEILKSYTLNYKVIRKLKDFHVIYYGIGRRGIVESVLYKTCPFVVKYDSLEIQPKGSKVWITITQENEYRVLLNGKPTAKKTWSFGENFNEGGFNITIEKRDSAHSLFSENGSNNYYFYFADLGRLANQYRSKLIVAPRDKESSVVSLTVSGFVPEQEIDYLNGLMDIYVQSGLDLKKGIAEQTLKFIDEQLDIISDSLELAANDLENFRTNNNFIELKNEISLIQDRLEKAYNERTIYELQLFYFNYLSDYLNQKDADGTIVSPSFIGITDQILPSLINKLSTLQKERDKLGFNLKDNQNAMEAVDQQIKVTQAAIRENIINSIANLNLLILRSGKEIALIENENNKLPATEKTYVNIQRKFDLNNTIYTYLLEKRSESGIAEASTLADNRPIDSAQLKGQVKPKEKNNYMIAFVFGLLIPAATIFIIDFFNNKVLDKKDVEKMTQVPIIGYVSHNDTGNEMAIIEKPGSALSESFRSIRTSIKYFVKENEVAVISVSSTVSSEGKTFISINLASIMAMLGKKVLLIGLDLRKPRINKVFEFENSPGMSTYLSGNCEYEEIIKLTQVTNLYYAPSGPIPPNPAELIETEYMKDFIFKARKEFDFIIIDTPPVAIVTDALLLAKYADINLFIVRQRYTSCNTLELIEQLNNKQEIKNMAIIINDISLSGYYGYGLRYGYMRGYGYSYGTAYYGSNYYGKYGKNDKVKGYYTES